MANRTIPESFAERMFHWIQGQGEALHRLPVTPENSEALMRSYEAMFRAAEKLAAALPSVTAAEPRRTFAEEMAAEITAQNETARRAAAAAAPPTAARATTPISLRAYGYSMKATTRARSESLRRAAQAKGAERVLQRLAFLEEVWGDDRKPEYLANVREDIATVKNMGA